MNGLPIYALTLFKGHHQTIPSAQYTGLTAAEIIANVANSDGPCVMTEKDRVPHFITSPLRVAPYVQNTALRFPPGAQGKQRSLAHVIESAWFPVDVDHATVADKIDILRAMEGRVFCVYSTFSHGEEVDNVRLRVLLFADRDMNPDEWKRARRVVGRELFQGKADTTSEQMHQLAAVWVAHPERTAMTFRHVSIKGALLKVDDLLAREPKPTPSQTVYIPLPTTRGRALGRYEAALQFLDAGCEHGAWQRTRLSLHAAVEVGALSNADGRALWLAWSATAPSARRSRNEQTQYDPEAMWDRKPNLTTVPDILVASLFARARDRTTEIVTAELPGPLSERAMQAARYLRDYHRKYFEQLRGKAV